MNRLRAGATLDRREGHFVIDLDALVRAADNLEPLPASTARLASLVSRNDPDIKEIVEVVCFDQALTGRLLRMANSPLSSSRSEVKTVREAVARLGTGTTLSLATGSRMRKTMNQALPEYGLPEGALWRHSVAAALAAELAARHARHRVPPESFTAALLHDVGKLVMRRFLYPEVSDLLGRSAVPSRLRAEVEILEVHHGELGGAVAHSWNLPESIVKGIIYHHFPDQGGEAICDVVHVANAVAKAAGQPDALAILENEHLPDARERMGLTPEGLARLTSDVGSRLEEVLSHYE